MTDLEKIKSEPPMAALCRLANLKDMTASSFHHKIRIQASHQITTVDVKGIQAQLKSLHRQPKLKKFTDLLCYPFNIIYLIACTFQKKKQYVSQTSQALIDLQITE